MYKNPTPYYYYNGLGGLSKWTDTDKFREAGLRFLKDKEYTHYKPGQIAYKEFWKEEKRRIKEGYEVDGQRICGLHYLYLNYCPIYNKKLGKKTLPDFWDLDADEFMQIEACMKDKEHFILVKARQKGEEQPDSEIVMTENGWKKIGDLKVGNKVYTPKGNLSTITEIFHHGKKDVYQVTLMDGRKVRCGLEHLWKVYDKQNNKYIIIRLEDLLKKNLTKEVNQGRNISYRFAIDDIAPIPFQYKELPIDPYLLGCLLGDGTLTKTLKIASNDSFIIEEFKDILGNKYSLNRDFTGINYRIKYKNNHDSEAYVKYNRRKLGRINPLREELKILGLIGKKCKDKFIPEVYKSCAIGERLEIVRGLMDTDGWISDEGDMEFKNTSKQLCLDLCEILRSLGLKVKMTHFPKEKNKGSKEDFYRLYIKSDTFNIFKLPRKASKFRKDKKIYKRNPIVKIEKLDYQEESSCILIDDPDHLYLTRDFIVTHNSFKKGVPLTFNLHFVPASMNYLGAYEKIQATKTWNMTKTYLNHLDKNTAFYKARDLGNTADHIGMGYKIVTEDGREYYGGYQSELYKVTFKDNPERGVGGAVSLFELEEPGVFPNFMDVLDFLDPATIQGATRTGIIIAGGSTGSIEKAEGIRKVFKEPWKFGFKKFLNVWEDEQFGEYCGYFVPEYICMDPYIDKDGNSDTEAALNKILEHLEVAKKKGYSRFVRYKTQHPVKPSDAFLNPNVNKFPVEALAKHLNFLDTQGQRGVAYKLYDDHGVIMGEPLPQITNPFEEYPIEPETSDGVEGVPWVYEAPVQDQYNGLYIASTDSVDQDKAPTSESILSCKIYRRSTGELDDNKGKRIVAHYDGRYDNAEKSYEIILKLTKWYNAKNLVENNNVGLINYYIKTNHEYLLQEQMDEIKGISITSVTQRRYGFTPTPPIIGHGNDLIYKYLTEVIGIEYSEVNGEKIPTREILRLETLEDRGLIREMIFYNPDGNFDRLDAFRGIMLYEEALTKYIIRKTSEQSSGYKQSIDFIERLFNKYKRNNKWNLGQQTFHT